MDAFDFSIEGIPASAQKRGSKSAWQDRIRRKIYARWPANRAPVSEELSATIIYFYLDDTNLDADNIPKPILDALVGVIYVDDSAISQVVVRKTKRDLGLVIRNPSPELADSLERISGDFVYVRIGEGPDHSEVPQ
jgi:crossover junction endodeoxyribonuclease RusA